MSRNKGIYYEKKAKEAGCKLVPGNGDHVKCYKPDNVVLPSSFRNPLIIDHNLKGDGTERVIIKWLRAVGVVLTLAIGLYLIQIVWSL